MSNDILKELAAILEARKSESADALPFLLTEATGNCP